MYAHKYIPQSVQSVGVSKVMELTLCSSLSKLLRVTALILKFIDICRKLCKSHIKHLIATDIAKAEEVWVKAIRRSAFVFEMQPLNNPGCSVMPLQHQLNLYLDTADVCCCQGLVSSANSKLCYHHTAILQSFPYCRGFYKSFIMA